MTSHDNGFFAENLSCPIRGAMRFHLVYSGPLSASGNKSKPSEVASVREQFHPQLKLLWETHAALKRLRHTALVVDPYGSILSFTPPPQTPFDDVETPPGSYDGFVDLCAPIRHAEYLFTPLVRQSLSLVCALDILFLRQEEPGALLLQGGDVDNRIKTLMDALRKPEPQELEKYPPKQEHSYCLLESDTLVSKFDVSTDRLLLPKSEFPNEVHLVIEVEVIVLNVGPWNLSLISR